MLKKGDDGTYRLFYPVDGAKAKFPLFDAASDTGKFDSAGPGKLKKISNVSNNNQGFSSKPSLNMLLS